MEYIDPSALMSAELNDWFEHWDMQLPLGANLTALIGKLILLPDAAIQTPILACYLAANTKWMKETPILFSYGRSGTGKSTAALLASKLHALQLLGSSSTYASMRNMIVEGKFPDPENEDRENDGAMLLFDNVNLSTFDDEDKKQILLSSYKRGSDRLAHAGKQGGGNMYFSCFTQIMMSSVHAIHSNPSYEEISRRLLIIFHEKVSEHNGELLEIEDINWDKFFETAYFTHWNNQEHIAAYLKAWKAAKSHIYPADCWNPARRSLVRYLLATGVCTGIWPTVKDAIAGFTAYWQYYDSKVKASSTDLSQYLKEWTTDRPYLTHPELVTQLDKWVNENRLLAKPRPHELGATMNVLGYVKTKDLWSKAS